MNDTDGVDPQLQHFVITETQKQRFQVCSVISFMFYKLCYFFSMFLLHYHPPTFPCLNKDAKDALSINV